MDIRVGVSLIHHDQVKVTAIHNRIRYDLQPVIVDDDELCVAPDDLLPALGTCTVGYLKRAVHGEPEQVSLPS